MIQITELRFVNLTKIQSGHRLVKIIEKYCKNIKDDKKLKVKMIELNHKKNHENFS